MDSGFLYKFFESSSGNLPVFCGSSRRTPEELSKEYRRNLEGIPKESRKKQLPNTEKAL
jgi:hypothetical protein